MRYSTSNLDVERGVSFQLDVYLDENDSPIDDFTAIAKKAWKENYAFKFSGFTFRVLAIIRLGGAHGFYDTSVSFTS